MPQMDSQDQEYEPARDEHTRLTNAEGTHDSPSFFVFLGSVIAILLLSSILYLPLSDFYKFLLLVLVLTGGTVMLLRYQQRQAQPAISDPLQDTADSRAEDEGEQDQHDDESVLQPAEVSFEQLVQEALDTIPAEFQQRMHNLLVVVENEPDAETLRRVGIKEGRTLLGLYTGVPLTAWGHDYTLFPERITIYQRTIERHCGADPERIRAQVYATVLHEVAHHFGMAHEEMPIWVK